MGVDADLTIIIREIVQFLESLTEVNLPSKIENARVSLLQKSKKKLSTITMTRCSPEPYLEMNAGKGFLLFLKKKNRESELEEYVGIEEPSEINSYQDYYETFQEGPTSNGEDTREARDNEKRKSLCKLESRDELLEKKLCDIYKTFSTAKTTSKAHKCGSLYQKLERKPFGFVRGNNRLCWVGLVGSHLLIYGSEDDKQPPEVCSIRGYSARPAASSMSRDSDRSKFVFEIFCPGNKTLQFVTKSTKEMDEWLDVINRTCSRQDKDAEVAIIEEKGPEECTLEEKYQDVGEVTSTLKDQQIVPNFKNYANEKKQPIVLPLTPPPALPVRTPPRRLPSLPNEEILAIPSSYEPLDDGYDEDDIYHKIEDIRENGRSYENVKKTKYSKKFLKSKKRKRKEVPQTEMYDDVESKNLTRRNEENGETYDDVQSIVSDSQISDHITNSPRRSCDILAGSKDQSFENYDDVCQLSSKSNDSEKGKNVDYKIAKATKAEKNRSEVKKDSSETKKAKGEKSCTKVEKSPKKVEKSPTKSPQKRSFLDRVRHRKDSPKKEDKKRSKENLDEKKTDKSEKCPENVEDLSKEAIVELPTYDDVSQVVADSTIFQITTVPKLSIIVDEASTYNCPPPPRPIYSKPPSPVPVLMKNIENEPADEIYDDIGNIHESVEKEMIIQEKFRNIARKEIDSKEIRSEFNNPENGRKVEKIYRTCAQIPVIDSTERNISVEPEHYQIPRSESVKASPPIFQGEEQLYDDVAVFNEVRITEHDPVSPKKSSVSSIIAETEKATFSVKKSWSRFGSGKKVASRDNVAQASSTKKSLDFDDFDDGLPIVEKQETMKLNKLQKLINKMENSLGKQQSPKSVTPILNKTQCGDKI